MKKVMKQTRNMVTAASRTRFTMYFATFSYLFPNLL